MLTPAPTSRGSKPRSERGQVLVIFIAVFSVILAMMAFSIDQGLFLNERRIAQKDADAVARAGVAEYIPAITSGAAFSTRFTQVTDAASEWAVLNGAEIPLPVTNTSANCPTTSGTISNAPSLEVAVRRPSEGLVLRAFGSPGAGDDIGARSTACIGSVQTIAPGPLETLPIAIYADDRESNSCFTASSVVRLGVQCRIKSGAQGSMSRGYFFVPDETECYGNGGGIPRSDEIVDGIGVTCEVNNGSCGTNLGCEVTTCAADDLDCTHPFNGTGGININRDFGDRLTRSANHTCARTLSAPGGSISLFSDIFDYADGSPGPVAGPPGVGGGDPVTTPYIQKDCVSPRVAMIIISDANEEAVRGFAAIYIVGCFDERDPISTTPNNCTANIPRGREEVRAVIVRVFLDAQSAGGIGSITINTPLAIQTTR